MYYFIMNPKSKSGKSIAIWKQIEQELNTKQINYRAIYTRYQGHATKLANHLCRSKKPKTIIVLGGDGTLSEVIQGISVPCPHTIGYIPTGSGNDFAKSMGLKSSPLIALSNLLTNQSIQEIDYGTVTFSNEISRRFIVSCGIGFDAAICQKSIHSPIKRLLNRIHLGSLSYLMIGIPTIFSHKSCNGTLVLDNKKKIPLNNLFFASIHIHPFEGGGFAFCPDANFTDGALDICVVEAKWIPKRILILLCSLLKKHTACPGVHIYRCQKATFFLDHPLDFHMDGECPTSPISSLTVSSSPNDHYLFLSSKK